MSLPEASIRRPITTLMVYVGVFLFGVISLGRLAQELFPPITYPQLTIVTPYENAAPEEIETLITKPIEEAVGGIAGVRKVSSRSREGLSLVLVEFGWNQNMDFASLGVREKIDLIKERLPRDAEEPVVIKYNPFELPVLSASLSSSKHSPVQLRELARKWFKDEIEKIHGVASASISGGAEEEILVDVDLAGLRASGVSIIEVQEAVTSANLNYPGGTIKESFYEYLVRTLGAFKHVGEVGQVPVRRDDIQTQKKRGLGLPEEEEPTNRLVLLKDIADIRRTIKQRTSFSRYDGRENVTISVQKQAQANTLHVANAVKKKLKELRAELPDDVHVDIVYDQSKFIREALNGVRDAALQGGFLAFLVLLVFLRDFKNSALVVTITPVTILATFTLMYFMNISLNVISLGGVALGVGMLLDNAVVVIENVYRRFKDHPADGMRGAAGAGTQEVIAPMWASTLTTVSVFLPIVFVTGIAGQIFKDLAWVVVVTQVISAVIAFTLLPVLLAKAGGKTSLTKKDPLESPAPKDPFHAVEEGYGRLLPAFMERKWRYLAGVFVVFLASVWLFQSLDKVLLPKVDQGQFMVKVDLPVGSRVEFTNEVTAHLENFLRAIADVKSVATVVGSTKGASSKEIVERLGAHQAQVVVTLEGRRKKRTDQIVQEVRRHFEEAGGKSLIRPARLSYVLYESAFKVGGDIDAPIVIDIKGPQLEELKSLALSVGEKISNIKGIYGVTNSVAEPFPETKILVDKDRAGFYKLSVVNIAQAANVAMKGIVASQFKEEGREIGIRVQLKEKDRDRLQKVGFLMIHSPLDVDVPLADFVKFETGKGPSEIRRISQERTIEVYAKIHGRELKDVIRDVEAAIGSLRVPPRYSVKMAGEKEEIRESFASLQFAFLLSVLLVYMIMAAQFESFWQPLLIMFCLPLSLIGVVAALWVSGTPISVVVILGIILLGGVVVNNGIILIDFINQKRAEGLPPAEAAVLAGRIRLRPILMTAFSSAIGLLPLALGIGEGAELQAPMARTVMGGILAATFLTLVVIPALYTGTEEIAARLRPSK